MSEPIPAPAAGRLTFDAEGQEGGPFHSRQFHVPTSSSGLTIGRGYDMKSRSKSEVRDDLVAAGVESAVAALISQAAGLVGSRAEEFIEENDLEDFEISPQTQLKLLMYEALIESVETHYQIDVKKTFGLTASSERSRKPRRKA